jgi:hypothetical protein
MAAAQVVAKGSVVSSCGNRAVPGLLGRRRDAVAAQMTPSVVRIGGSWRNNVFPGVRLALAPWGRGDPGPRAEVSPRRRCR